MYTHGDNVVEWSTVQYVKTARATNSLLVAVKSGVLAQAQLLHSSFNAVFVGLVVPLILDCSI